MDNLVAWALANGFTGREVDRLRDYATKVLQGHRNRHTRRPILVDHNVELWEQEAEQRQPVQVTPIGRCCTQQIGCERMLPNRPAAAAAGWMSVPVTCRSSSRVLSRVHLYLEPNRRDAPGHGKVRLSDFAT